MNSYKKLMIGVCSFIVIGIIAIAYAAFTGQLSINGTGVNRKSNFDIYFDNLRNVSLTGTAIEVVHPTISGTTISEYDVKLISPGDSVSYTFDVINNGDYDAKIDTLNISNPDCGNNSSFCNNLTYTLRYDNNSIVQINDIILAGETQTMVLTLTYNDDISASDLPNENIRISNLGIDINYIQEDSAITDNMGNIGKYKFYKIGDKITVHNEDYWIIEKSLKTQDYVIALKDEPLTVAEVNLYGGVGTEDNHVNRYTWNSQNTAQNLNGYGGMSYSSNSECLNWDHKNGCIGDYDLSDIKYVIDNWTADKFSNNELREIDGYESRLITVAELLNNLKCNNRNCANSGYNWVYNQLYRYTTMNNQSYYGSYFVSINGVISNSAHWDSLRAVRPVINVYKSAIQ